MSFGKLALHDIQKKLRKFAEDRNWNQFYSPKNLKIGSIIGKRGE